MTDQLQGGGSFALEMGFKLQRDEQHPFREHILAVDRLLATYREAVAADQAKRTPSGAPYWTAYQLSERQTEHAVHAANAIRSRQPTGLQERISSLKAQLAARGIPTYSERRLATIERQLEPILHDVIQIRERLRDAIARGDAEVVHVILTWPGYDAGQIVGDRQQPEKLLPVAEQFLRAHTSPKETAELATLEADQMALDNIYRTAIRDLEKEAPAIMPDPIAEMAKGTPPDAA